MKISVFQRLRNGVRAETYSYKFTWRGKQIPRKTLLTNAADCMRVARAHVKALELGCVDEVDGQFRMRSNRATPTVAALLATANKLAAGLMRPESAHNAGLQLLNLLRRSGAFAGSDVAQLHLTELSGALVRRFADAVLREAVAEQAGERRMLQMQRTANSTHAMACVLFGRKLSSRYPDNGIEVPACVSDFAKACPFPDSDPAIRYNTPPDHIIRATLEDLENVQRTANPNLYCAVWLALGYGLRKGEIFGARIRNLQARAGKRVFIIEENWVARKKRILPKNDREDECIQDANGAWTKLAPLLASRQPDDYMLTGDHHSARTQYVATAVSDWMRGLGWGTQKTLHAWRAYAIAQVVKQTRNMKEASLWARHSSVLTTERCYGHFLTVDIESVPLKLPEVPATFTPAVVSTPVSSEQPMPQPAVG